LAADYNISNDELKMQIALGAADIGYLNPDFIKSRQNSSIIAALATMWAKTGLFEKQTLDVADALIAHPHITEKDREYVVNLRNAYIHVRKQLYTMYDEALVSFQSKNKSSLEQRIQKLLEL